MPPSSAVRAARCAYHHGREAAARCPSCHRDYCRECVTEHRGRLLCITCLAAATARRAHRRSIVGLAFLTIAFCAAFVASIVFFCLAGIVMSRLDSSAHSVFTEQEAN